MKYKLKNKEIELTDEEVKEIVEQNSKPKEIEIKRWDNGEVTFTSYKETMKEAVEEAVSGGISLSYADLENANLENAILKYANLNGAILKYANLRNADLEDAKFYGIGGTQKLTREQLPVFLRALGFIIEDL